MTGILILILDIEPIGLYHTDESELIESPGMLANWFRDYDDSDAYNELGIDGFEEYVAEIGYKIERVFIHECSI